MKSSIAILAAVLSLIGAVDGAGAAALGVTADGGLSAGQATSNAAAATALHLTWSRVDVSWPVVAPTQPLNARLPTSGGYVWSSIDTQLAAAASLGPGTQVLFSVSGTPYWARADNGAGGLPDDTSWTPRRSAWQNFIAALATRYNGRFAALEVWPQPNLLTSLRPQRIAGRLVAPGFLKVLTNRATLEVRKLSATVPIVTGGLARTDPTSTSDTPSLTFLRAMGRTRMAFDAIGLRLVPPNGLEGLSDPTNLSLTDSAGIVAAVDSYWPNAGTRIWLTGYGVHSGPAEAGLSYATQSVGITSLLSASANPRIDVALWNSLANTTANPYGGLLLAPTVNPFVAPTAGADPAWDTWTTIVPVPATPPA